MQRRPMPACQQRRRASRVGWKGSDVGALRQNMMLPDCACILLRLRLKRRGAKRPRNRCRRVRACSALFSVPGLVCWQRRTARDVASLERHGDLPVSARTPLRGNDQHNQCHHSAIKNSEIMLCPLVFDAYCSSNLTRIISFYTVRRRAFGIFGAYFSLSFSSEWKPVVDAWLS